MATMKEKILKKFQDLEDTQDPVIESLTWPNQVFDFDDYVKFFKAGKTRKMYWLSIKDMCFEKVK
mgnify:CR=1 FL=1